MSTRPRITFNAEGVCSACQWAEEKKKLNWDERQKMLDKLLSKAGDNFGPLILEELKSGIFLAGRSSIP